MCRSPCKIVFPLDLDLRPCLDSPSSRLRSEAVSGYGSLKSGEKMSHMGALLTRGRLTDRLPAKGGMAGGVEVLCVLSSVYVPCRQARYT